MVVSQACWDGGRQGLLSKVDKGSVLCFIYGGRDRRINKQKLDRDSSHLATLCCDLMRKSNDKHTHTRTHTSHKHHPHKNRTQAYKERQSKINISS